MAGEKQEVVPHDLQQDSEFENVQYTTNTANHEDFTINKDTDLSRFETIIPPSYDTINKGGRTEEDAITPSPCGPSNQYIQKNDVNLQSAVTVVDEDEVVEKLERNFESIPPSDDFDNVENQISTQCNNYESIENHPITTDNHTNYDNYANIIGDNKPIATDELPIQSPSISSHGSTATSIQSENYPEAHDGINSNDEDWKNIQDKNLESQIDGINDTDEKIQNQFNPFGRGEEAYIYNVEDFFANDGRKTFEVSN